jgi:hypothetical protein
MTTEAGGSSAHERPVRPSPSEWRCSHCGFALPRDGGALRHYGTHTAHQESECLRLLQAEIARLKDAMGGFHTKTRQYMLQLDSARYRVLREEHAEDICRVIYGQSEKEAEDDWRGELDDWTSAELARQLQEDPGA